MDANAEMLAAVRRFRNMTCHGEAFRKAPEAIDHAVRDGRLVLIVGNQTVIGDIGFVYDMLYALWRETVLSVPSDGERH